MNPLRANWISDGFFDAVNSLLSWVRDQMTNLLGFDFVERIGAMWAMLDFIRSNIAKANGVFPFGTCIMIVLTGFALKMTIRGVRWILSAIPFVHVG